ncbi:MAG: nucleotidyl transferase AbiEii/AbiGii toxin family protein [Enhygromyxa sp.]
MNGSDLARTIFDLKAALTSLDGSFMLIGGLAVVLRGFPRHTDDIDVAVLGAEASADRLARLLIKGGFVPRIDDAVAFAEQNQVLLFRHSETGIEVDVSLAWLPFEEEAVAAAERIDVEGIRLPVARVEDLLIYKAVAWRERDRRDIRELLGLYHDELDLDRVREVIAQFAAVIDEPERLAEFERLVDEVASGFRSR